MKKLLLLLLLLIPLLSIGQISTYYNNDVVYIQLDGEYTKSIDAKLYTISGKLCFNQPLANTGYNLFYIRTDDKRTGIYVLTISYKDVVMKKSIVLL